VADRVAALLAQKDAEIARAKAHVATLDDNILKVTAFSVEMTERASALKLERDRRDAALLEVAKEMERDKGGVWGAARIRKIVAGEK